MGLRVNQGDEKRLLSSSRSLWKRRPLLCHPERSRGICSFRGPLLDMLSDRVQREISIRGFVTSMILD